MKIIHKLRFFYQWLFDIKSDQVQSTYDIGYKEPRTDSKPDIFFKSISFLSKTPTNDAVHENEFIVVQHEKPFWALFRCPCGCGNVISLSLQGVHNPHWRITKTDAGRPSLYPSVWQNKGCCSHFWIKDGCVYWCDNTGIEPWMAEPKYYSKPRF